MLDTSPVPAHSRTRRDLFSAIQTAWIATGLSLITGLTAATIRFESLVSLFASDDAYIMGLIVACTVGPVFLIVAGVRWWTGSERAEWIIAACLLSLTVIAMTIFELLPTGEVDGLWQAWAWGVAIGGTVGMTAYILQSDEARWWLPWVSHVLYGVGFFIASMNMSLH